MLLHLIIIHVKKHEKLFAVFLEQMHLIIGQMSKNGYKLNWNSIYKYRISQVTAIWLIDNILL